MTCVISDDGALTPYRTDFPSKLREIIENPKVYKLGVNVIGDAQKLVRDYGNLYMKGVLDLSYIARAVDEANCKPGGSKIALAKLCEQYTGCELDKGPVRQSDWSKRLSQAQMDCKWFDYVVCVPCD
jgi:ribonuclease D